MQFAPILVLACIAAAGVVETTSEISGLGRSLLQAPAPNAATSSLKIPTNRMVASIAQNATQQGTDILGQAGKIQLADLKNIVTNGAYKTAVEGLYAAAAGQTPATLAAVAATGATLLAAEGALTNDPAVISEAKAALSQVQSLINAISDVDTIQVSAKDFADLALLGNLAYETTQVLYYQNFPSASAANGTFSDEVAEVGYLLTVLEAQVPYNVSESLTILGSQHIAHYLLAAVATFQGNDTGVSQQTIAMSQILLQAVNAKQTGTSCSSTWASVKPLVEKAEIDATTATQTLSPADINTAVSDANAVLSGASCSSVSPALAPSSEVASAGRK